jgi:hypothetical protein
VADTGERDVPLDHRHGHQLPVRDGHRPVDHTVDLELPAVGIDAGDRQVGVDSIERGIAGPQRGDARHLALYSLREGTGGVSRPGQRDLRDGVCRSELLPEGGSPDRARGDSRCADQELSAPVVRGGVCVAGSS